MKTTTQAQPVIAPDREAAIKEIFRLAQRYAISDGNYRHSNSDSSLVSDRLFAKSQAAQNALEAAITKLADSNPVIEPVAQPVTPTHKITAWRWDVLPGGPISKRGGSDFGFHTEDPATLGISIDHPEYKWTTLCDVESIATPKSVIAPTQAQPVAQKGKS